MSLAAKAVWVLERNLGEAHTLDSLAQDLGVTRFHLAHAFAAAAGQPVLHYLRGRRLSEAARKLAGGAGDILQLALESGYSSHEAFSRAFRERLGLSPDGVRKAGSVEALPLQAPLRLPRSQEGALKKPRFERAPARTFLGLSQRHLVGDAPGIAGQWPRFMERFHELEEALLDPIPWGLSGPIGDEGAFTYTAAALVRPGTRGPKGLERLEVAAQAYAVFTHSGHASLIGQTYAAIWNEWLPSSGRAVAQSYGLDRHLPSFDPRTGLGAVELWLPVTGP
jgi:AraC family transcriptional regulator